MTRVSLNTSLIALLVLVGSAAAAPDDLNKHLSSARDSVVKRDARAAASEVRAAAQGLYRESEKAGGAVKTELRASAAELDRLAVRLGKGTGKGAEELAAPFGRACRAMAESHFARSSEAWAKHETKRAGHSLQAAGDDLAAAARWTDREGDEALIGAANGARAMGRDLAAGASRTADEVGSSMRAFGRELQNLEQRVASSHR